MKLHDVEGRNSYCGPAAISTVAGVTTDEAARIIRERRAYYRPVRGCHYYEVLQALNLLGYTFESYTSIGKLQRGVVRLQPTLKQWLAERDRRADHSQVFLVNVTGHFIVIRGSILVDSHHRNGELIEDVGGLRRRVKRAWKLTKSV